MPVISALGKLTAKEFGAQSYPWLHSKFETSLEYIRTHFNKNRRAPGSASLLPVNHWKSLEYSSQSISNNKSIILLNSVRLLSKESWKPTICDQEVVGCRGTFC